MRAPTPYRKRMSSPFLCESRRQQTETVGLTDSLAGGLQALVGDGCRFHVDPVVWSGLPGAIAVLPRGALIGANGGADAPPWMRHHRVLARSRWNDP